MLTAFDRANRNCIGDEEGLEAGLYLEETTDAFEHAHG
jgi:hypothetical protein